MSMQPVSQPISPLRRRMLEDMAMRGLATEFACPFRTGLGTILRVPRNPSN